MNRPRPSLARSVSFWGLVLLSLAAVVFGAWLALTQIAAMNAALAAETATLVDVYSGQSLAVLGAVVLGAGLVGILLALAVGSARTFVARSFSTSWSPAVPAESWEAAPTDRVAADATPAARSGSADGAPAAGPAPHP